MRFFFLVAIALTTLLLSCSTRQSERTHDNTPLFPRELTRFRPFEGNPVFRGSEDSMAWDNLIRERGFILRESDGYHLWYTGYNENESNPVMHPGYATSPDGIHWTRYSTNPVFTDTWVEDMMVIKTDTGYLMFAEGRDDIAHLLVSNNKTDWKEVGPLDIRYTNGEPLTPGPYGTPTVFFENGRWYLFYERNDEGIWLATSTDLKTWVNIDDEPVLKKGPEEYDRYGVAVNQVLRFGDRYYAFYHGTAFEDWREWSTNIAVSSDLRTWEKFSGNPIMKENKSSGIVVHDGKGYRLYTMHPVVNLHFPE